MIQKLIKSYLLILAVVGFNSISEAQNNFGFYGGLQLMPQAHAYNPAFSPENKFHFSLGTGMHSLGFSNSGFTLNDILVERAQDDSLVLSPSNAISKMAKLNHLGFNVQNELLSFGMKLRKTYFSVGLYNRLSVQFAYPKDFFSLLVEGNGGSLLGQRAELAFGANREFGDKLKLGARFKLLSGIGNVKTEKSVLGLTTDATTFDLTLDGELDLRTSGLPINGLNYDPMTALTARNKGFAFHFGGSYQLSEKLLISASLLDLGSIKWTQNVQNYKRSSFSYTFEGVDLNQAINDSNYFETLADTLEHIFKVEGNTDSYRAVLPARFIVGANMELTKMFGAGAFLFSDFTNNKYRPTLMLQGSLTLKKWFMLNATYSVSARSATNVGVSVGLKGSGMAYFISFDNVFGFIAPARSKNFHISTGLAFCIGRDRDKEVEEE